MSYMDQFETDNIQTTPMEVIAVMIERLQDAASELEYISTEEFCILPPEKQTEIWSEARMLVRELTQDQKKLMFMMTNMFEHAYFNAIDFIDRMHRHN